MFEQEQQILNKLSKYEIEIGVIYEDTKREEVSVGLTNAELMFIHENGSPTRNIPARPVLQMTIDWANSGPLNKVLDKIVNNIVDGTWKLTDCEKELDKFCVRMENYARDIIYSNDGRLAPNSPRVAARKKGNHPLFDTGQLARSITCRLRKI